MHPGGQTVDNDAVTQKREAGLGNEGSGNLGTCCQSQEQPGCSDPVVDLRPSSLNTGKFWGKRGPTGEAEGAGDPTDHICSHAGNPKPQSPLSAMTLHVVTAPPGEARDCKYTAAHRGSRAGAKSPVQ